MMKTKHSRPRQSLRRAIIGGLCAASLHGGTVFAAPGEMTADKLLDICAAPSVEIAAERGSALGWQKLTDAELEEWRSAMIGSDAGSVDIVGWQRTVTGRPDFLSFWTASRLPGLRTCSYSTPNAAGLFDGLSEQLGAPDKLDRDDATRTVTALWLRNAVEYSFVQVRSSAIVTIGPQR